MQLDHEFHLNPDGSGKVHLRWEGGGEADPGEFLRTEIAEAKGVDAWGGIECAVAEGDLRFHATAWFPSVEGLRFHCQGFHFSVHDFTVAKDAEGNLRLRGSRAPSSPGSPAAPGLEGEALAARIAEEREKFSQGREFLAEMFGSLRCRTTIHLPGRIGRVANAKKVDARTLRQDFSGKALVDVVDRLLVDDDLAARLVRIGTEGPEALQELLGDVGPIEADTVGTLSPAFDYAAEVAAAREAFEGTRREMGLPAPAEEADPLREARIVAAKAVREGDPGNELAPMGQNHPGLSVAIAGSLPGPALSLKDARVDSAVTDTGEELATGSEWDRTAHFPKLTRDRRTAVFEFDLPAPPPGASGWKEIRGALRAVVSESEEQVDLGFRALAQGAEGSRAGAVLQRAEEPGDGTFLLEVKLLVPRETVLAMAVVPPGGEPVELRERGYSASGGECELTYAGDGELDPHSRLVARMATGIRHFVVPFRVEGVDFLGRPR